MPARTRARWSSSKAAVNGPGRNGTALRIEARISARRAGRFPLTLAALIFRIDSVVATRHVAQPIELDVSDGDAFVGELRLDPLILGNGTYLVSVGLYRTLDVN